MRGLVLACIVGSVLCQRTHQGVTWDQDQVKSIPQVFTTETDRDFIERAHKLRIVAITEGCSDYEKRMIILEDGTKVCCKHRVNYQQLQSELYSFHLSRLLNIYNVPPAIIVKVDYGSAQWRAVVQDANKAGLRHGMVVVFTEYLENLLPTYIPPQLQIKNEVLLPTNISLKYLPERTIHQLIQWTNLIVFDYITANSDRVMNALSNLQWNPRVIKLPVHNLYETSQGTIVFIDNESGFWLGYKLASESENHQHLQKSYITKICIVDGTVLHAIEQLLDLGGEVLHKRLVEHDPTSCRYIPMIRDSIVDELENRLTFTLNTIHSCSKSS
ncbi:four-jointed box protein 1-like [Dysidea avara]|uniref:four-jointed box protein 1-like n=1 Tax=Dysidea avara TaxID=196820 RepID=UPI003326A43F